MKEYHKMSQINPEKFNLIYVNENKPRHIWDEDYDKMVHEETLRHENKKQMCKSVKADLDKRE